MEEELWPNNGELKWGLLTSADYRIKRTRVQIQSNGMVRPSSMRMVGLHGAPPLTRGADSERHHQERRANARGGLPPVMAPPPAALQQLAAAL